MPDYRTEEWQKYFEANGIDQPTESTDTAEASYVEESGTSAESNGKWADTELTAHDIQAALNAIARRMSILEAATRNGRLSERAMALSEYKSLHRVNLALIDLKDAITRSN